MALGLFPMSLGLARPAPFLPALSQLQQGAGRGKKRRDELNWAHLVSRSNLAWGQGRAGLRVASLRPRLSSLGLSLCGREGLEVCLDLDLCPPCHVWGLVGGRAVGTASVSLGAERLPVPRDADAEAAMGRWGRPAGGLPRLLGGEGSAARLVKSVTEPQVCAGRAFAPLIVTGLPGPERSLATDPVLPAPPLASWFSGNA